MDRHTVFTLALQLMGEQEFRENAATQNPCEVWFNPVLRLACARYNWTFMAREAVLKPVKDAVCAPGEVLFPCPDGCLKVTRMRTQEGGEVRWPRIVSSGIVVGENEGTDVLRVNYQSDLVAIGGVLPDSAPEFCDGVVHLLASRVCMPITSNAKLAEALAERAEWCFQSAITSDRQQDGSNAVDPMTRMRKQNIFRGI